MLWTIHRINVIRPGRDTSSAVLCRPYNERSNLLPELRTTVCSARQARAPRRQVGKGCETWYWYYSIMRQSPIPTIPRKTPRKTKKRWLIALKKNQKTKEERRQEETGRSGCRRSGVGGDVHTLLQAGLGFFDEPIPFCVILRIVPETRHERLGAIIRSINQGQLTSPPSSMYSSSSISAPIRHVPISQRSSRCKRPNLAWDLLAYCSYSLTKSAKLDSASVNSLIEARV